MTAKCGNPSLSMQISGEIVTLPDVWFQKPPHWQYQIEIRKTYCTEYLVPILP